MMEGRVEERVKIGEREGVREMGGGDGRGVGWG